MKVLTALVNVQISAELQQRIYDQLQTTYPNEGGGFLLGARDSAGIVVRDVRPITNIFPTEEQFHRYAMTPSDWIKLEDEADAAGLTLVGYYHSHPDWPAIPSDYDRDHALPNFCYIITSVQKGTAADFRAWQLVDDRTKFDELALTVN